MLKEPLVALSDLVLQRLSETRPVVLEGAINATGIILHTGLGRAPLAVAAVTAMSEVAGGYAPVELNLATGERGRRSDLIRARGMMQWPDGTRTPRYRFVHETFRRVAYRRIDPARRERIHAALGARLETALGGGERMGPGLCRPHDVNQSSFRRL